MLEYTGVCILVYRGIQAFVYLYAGVCGTLAMCVECGLQYSLADVDQIVIHSLSAT
jgi:hypothetical protein